MTVSSSATRIVARLVIASMFALACPVQAGATLGRLFLTPEERVTLERLRYAPQAETVVERQAEAAAAPVDPVRLDGYVERHDGHSSAWFNGAVVHDGTRDNGLQATDAVLPEVGVRLVDGSAVRLRVGQTYDPVSNTIIESWQREPAASAASAPEQGAAAPAVDGEVKE